MRLYLNGNEQVQQCFREMREVFIDFHSPTLRKYIRIPNYEVITRTKWGNRVDYYENLKDAKKAAKRYVKSEYRKGKNDIDGTYATINVFNETDDFANDKPTSCYDVWMDALGNYNLEKLW